MITALGDAAARVRRVRAWPLRAYFLLLVALFVVAAGTAAVYVHVQTNQDARREAEGEARFAARTAAKQLGDHIALVRATVGQLAANPQITQTFSNPKGCSLAFGGLGGPDRGHLDIVRADGTVACSSAKTGGARPAGYAGKEWLRRALVRPVLIAPTLDPATGAQVAISASPIPNRRGIVAGFVDLAALGPHLASLYGGGEPTEFLVTSSTGRVVARSIDPGRWIGASLAGTAFAQSGDRVERPDLDGRSRLYAQSAVTGLGWRFYAGKDKAAALASGSRLEKRQLGVITAGLVAFLLAAWLVYRNLAAPIRRLSGAVRPISAHPAPVSVPVSGPAEVAALAEEINGLISSVNRELLERQRAEEHARISEQNYRLLFESNPNPMWVFDTETLAFLAVNEAAIRGYGYSRDEFLAMTLADIRPPEDRPRLYSVVASDVEANGNRGLNPAGLWRHRRKDGTTITAEVTSNSLAFEGRQARVVLALDVTERERAEQELRQSETRYRDLIENAKDLIVSVDLEDRLVSVNAAFEQALGCSRTELIGRTLAEFVPPEYHAQLQDAYEAKIRKEAKSTTYEHELIASDGQRIAVEVSSHLIEHDGQPVGAQAIFRDITERKLLEEQLRQGQRLESVGRLAGGIARDFNNLLTVISGYAEALLEERGAGTEPELQHIADAAERATRLTRQLLAFSRRQVLQPRVLDLNEVIEEVTPMLGRLIGEDVDLIARSDPTLAHVLADSTQIEQVLVNLVVNARDAMPHGGKLTIETGNVYLDADYAAGHPEATVGPHAMLAVSDTGMGMDADTVAHVFEPFYTTKPVGTGTGLGLSTVYGIVKQSGGNIWIYSEPGKGTTFKVYLPAADAPLAAERQQPAPTVAPTGTETVLIVEDEEVLRDLAAHILDTRGYTVIAAGSPEEALGLVEQQNEIDLLLTDVVMPQMGGRELAERITEQIPAIRVLFMSGYADEAITRHGALDTGAAFLEKPLSANQLARKVREVLDRSE